MRITRFRVFLLLGASLLVLGPAVGLGQPGGYPGGAPSGDPGQAPGGFGQFQGRQGGRQGRQGQGGRQGRGMDPNMIFNFMSGGKDYIVVAEMLANPMVQARDPGAKDRIEAFMQRNGITNGQLTRDQFAQFMQERTTELARPNGRRRAEPRRRFADARAATADPNGDGSNEPVVEDKRPTALPRHQLAQGAAHVVRLHFDSGFGQGRPGRPVRVEERGPLRRASSRRGTSNGDGFITIEEAMRVAKGTTQQWARRSRPWR